MALRSQALELIKFPRLQTVSQRPKTLHRLANPFRYLLRVFSAPRITFGVAGANGHDEFHAVEARQRCEPRFGRRRVCAVRLRRASDSLLSRLRLIQRLGRFEQQTLVGIED